MANQILITIRRSANEMWEQSVNLDQTVLELKEMISQKIENAPPSLQRLIFKGKILKDTQTLSNCEMHAESPTASTNQNAQTSSQEPQPQAPNLPQTTPQSGQPTAPPMDFSSLLGNMGGFGFPTNQGQQPDLSGLAGMMGQGGQMDFASMAPMLQNPAMLSNPEMLRAMLASNPQLSQAFGGNTEQLMASLQNPFVQQMLQNPAMLSGLMGMGGQGMPGQQPMNTQNPIPGSFGQNTSFPQPPQATQVPQQPVLTDEQLQEQYRSQLAQLSDMGFTNPRTNLEVLKQTNGNVEAAVERLLNLIG